MFGKFAVRFRRLHGSRENGAFAPSSNQLFRTLQMALKGRSLMDMPRQPLVEVFGFPIADQSDEANRHRHHRLCPFNNRVPSCTKDKIDDPLGVCSIYEGDLPTIVCPVRFREAWHIASDAAEIFFPDDAHWTSHTNVPVKDARGRPAGEIDLVLVSYDKQGNTTHSCSLQILEACFPADLRVSLKPFTEGSSPVGRNSIVSKRKVCSRCRLHLFLNGTLHSRPLSNDWTSPCRGKKMAVAIDRRFLSELPDLVTVDKHEGDLVWLVYDLVLDASTRRYRLRKHSTVETKFDQVVGNFTTEDPHSRCESKALLWAKLRQKLLSLTMECPDVGIASIVDASLEIDGSRDEEDNFFATPLKPMTRVELVTC